jgi:hypothetical protein
VEWLTTTWLTMSRFRSSSDGTQSVVANQERGRRHAGHARSNPAGSATAPPPRTGRGRRIQQPVRSSRWSYQAATWSRSTTATRSRRGSRRHCLRLWRLAGSSHDGASALFAPRAVLRRGLGRCGSAVRFIERTRTPSSGSSMLDVAKWEAEEALEYGVHLLRDDERAEMPRTDGLGDHQPWA